MSRMFSGAWAAVLGASTLAVAGCQPGPKDVVQRGFRGTGMDEIYDKSDLARRVDSVAKLIPASLPPSGPPTAGPSPWHNVQVLKDVSPAEFTRTMLAMSTWVAGTGNCAYCHNLGDMAADTLKGGTPIYTKITARRMLRMVRDINGGYQEHVKNTGVTCYTCHLGKPVPNNVWFYDGNLNQVERYFLDRNAVRVQTHVVEASNDNRSSVKQTEWTYAVMMKISHSLGVSCLECHNTRAFNSWQQAPPQRVQALHGAEMVRHVNYQYLLPLNAVLPAGRLGPMGDSPKVQCATCHNGAYKPLYGYPMAKDYPALWGRGDWNGVAFPAVPAGAASAAGAAGNNETATSGAAAPAPASIPVSQTHALPSPKPVYSGGTGAMGGQGPSVGPAPVPAPTAPKTGAMGGKGPSGKVKPVPAH